MYRAFSIVTLHFERIRGWAAGVGLGVVSVETVGFSRSALLLCFYFIVRLYEPFLSFFDPIAVLLLVRLRCHLNLGPYACKLGIQLVMWMDPACISFT